MSHETHSFQLTFAGITVNKEHYHLEPFMITKILSKFLTVFQCTFTQKRMEGGGGEGGGGGGGGKMVG